MSSASSPPCPPSLKQIQHFLKTASEHDERDVVIAYWCRLYALQLGLKLDRSSQEAKKLLGWLMDWLEKTKAASRENEAILHDIPAQAHLENYALKLFLWADSQDRSANFNKNVVKAFYTAGVIYDVLETFGEPTEEVQQNKKYAKWKAAYIHNCLKNGETPIPGPMDEGENVDEPSSSNVQPSPAPGYPTTPGSGFPTPVFPTPGGNGSTSPEKPSMPAKQTSLDPETKPLDPAEVLNFTNPPSVTPKSSGSGAQLSAEQVTKAQKYCKWAASALNYDDVPTAVSNLQKALSLLTTGVDE